MRSRTKDSSLPSSTATNNKSWDGQAKEYLCHLFSKFSNNPSTGISPHLNKDPQAVLRLHTTDAFLNRYKRNRFHCKGGSATTPFVLAFPPKKFSFFGIFVWKFFFVCGESPRWSGSPPTWNGYIFHENRSIFMKIFLCVWIWSHV